MDAGGEEALVDGSTTTTAEEGEFVTRAKKKNKAAKQAKQGQDTSRANTSRTSRPWWMRAAHATLAAWAVGNGWIAPRDAAKVWRGVLPGSGVCDSGNMYSGEPWMLCGGRYCSPVDERTSPLWPPTTATVAAESVNPPSWWGDAAPENSAAETERLEVPGCRGCEDDARCEEPHSQVWSLWASRT